MAKPSGTSVSSLGHTSRSTGTSPPRCSASSGVAARVRSAEKATAPVVETTLGSSVTASTAAKPTPNWPIVPPFLVDARNDASAVTPAASSGTPVFAARSSPSTTDSRSVPSSSPAASEAFCASSTSSRSR